MSTLKIEMEGVRLTLWPTRRVENFLRCLRVAAGMHPQVNKY